MNRALDELLQLAGSDDLSIQREAIFQLSLLLQRSNTRGIPDTAYRGLLAPNLMQMKLTESEQRKVVAKFRVLINSPERTTGILSAIGRASPRIGIEPLLSVIREHWTEFDDETAYQAVIALDNFLVYGDRVQFIPEVTRELREQSPLPFLQKSSTSKERRLREHSQRLLRILDAHGFDSVNR